MITGEKDGNRKAQQAEESTQEFTETHKSSSGVDPEPWNSFSMSGGHQGAL